MKKYFRPNKSTPVIATISVIVLMCVSLFGCQSAKEDSLVETLSSYQGYVRVVSQEEYDFYRYFVERDAGAKLSQEDLDEKVKAYTNQVNATFFLGNKLGLYEPYSFNLLQIRMEQENDNRKVKLEQGEAVYGLEQFDLYTYFQYELSNLKIDIQSYILEHCDSQIKRQAEVHYNSNKENYVVRDMVEYQITIDDETESVVADRTQLKFLGSADSGLADFLVNADLNETYEDVWNGKQRSVVVTDVEYQEISFKENEMSAIENYIEAKLYPSLIDEIAKNNPVEFDLKMGE